MSSDKGSMSGLTEDEAMEFHRFYLQGMFLFVGMAILAHVLVWAWRPWIPAEGGYGAIASQLTALLS